MADEEAKASPTDPNSRIMKSRMGYLQGYNTQSVLPRRGGDPYRLRGQTVVPVFGQMKENQRADAFIMRGHEECEGEWALHCAARNLRKLHSASVCRRKKAGKWLLN